MDLRAIGRALAIGLLTLPLSGAAAPDPASPGLPDVVEAGRVAAQLSDWQTITFFLIVLLVVGVLERLWTSWRANVTAVRLSDAIDRLAEADRLESVDLKVQLALVQDTLARLERRL